MEQRRVTARAGLQGVAQGRRGLGVVGAEPGHAAAGRFLHPLEGRPELGITALVQVPAAQCLLIG